LDHKEEKPGIMVSQNQSKFVMKIDQFVFVRIGRSYQNERSGGQLEWLG
jgi:hypothetical protein